MKISDSIKYSWIKTIRDKKNIYFIIVITLCSFILVASIFFRINYINSIDLFFNNSIEGLKLIITPNYDEYENDLEKRIKEIDSLKEVTDVYDFKYETYLVEVDKYKNDAYNGQIELLYGSEVSQPDNIIGKKIKEGDTGVAICPKKFYPSTEFPDTYLDSNIFYDGEKLIGEKFSISVDKYDFINDKLQVIGKYDKEYEIIGTYDHKENYSSVYNCYISSKDMKDLYDSTFSIFNRDSVPSFVVTVDKKNNLDLVTKKINDLGFSISFKSNVDQEFVNRIKNICDTIVLVDILMAIIITSSYIKKQKIDSTMQIGVLKSLGYKNSNIITSAVIDTVISMVISLVITFVLYITIFILLNHYLNVFMTFNNIDFKFLYSPYVFAIVTMIVISVVANIVIVKKIINSQILKILRLE